MLGGRRNSCVNTSSESNISTQAQDRENGEEEKRRIVEKDHEKVMKKIGEIKSMRKTKVSWKYR